MERTSEFGRWGDLRQSQAILMVDIEISPRVRHAGHHAPSKDSHIGEHLALLAAYGGSTFNRTCSRRTFEAKGRSMQTQDMLPLIAEVFVEVFGGEEVRSDEAAEYFQDGGADYIQ